jgi:hypothetical protein
MPTTNFLFLFLFFQLYILLISSYLIRNCYTVCACFRAGASTFQVLARYDPIRARHDSARAYLFPRPRPLRYRPRLFIFHPHPFIFHPRPFTFRIFRARFVYIRACHTNVHAWQTYVSVRKNLVRARRCTVRALEHPVRASINAFVLKGSREITTTCARGTISPRPFAVHSVQSPYTWACNCACSCLPGTLWVRTKADFI